MSASRVHLDTVYARGDVAKRNLVIGTYVYAMRSDMSVPDVSDGHSGNVGARDLRHIKPVFEGDTLSASRTALGKTIEDSPLRG